MKTIGLIGGLSWHSTITYYKIINQIVGERLGGAHSAKILLYSVDFDEFVKSQESGGWQAVETMLGAIAIRLEAAGADCLLLCTNTPHIIADGLQKRIGIPLLHIADVTAAEIKRQNIDKVVLLGTKFTMEADFFKDRLIQNGITPLIPTEQDRDFIHNAIFNEMTRGLFLPAAKQRFIEVIEGLKGKGALGVIFGCSEIPMLVKQGDISIKAFDTAEIHAKAAAEFALSDL